MLAEELVASKVAAVVAGGSDTGGVGPRRARRGSRRRARRPRPRRGPAARRRRRDRARAGAARRGLRRRRARPAARRHRQAGRAGRRGRDASIAPRSSPCRRRRHSPPTASAPRIAGDGPLDATDCASLVEARGAAGSRVVARADVSRLCSKITTSAPHPRARRVVALKAVFFDVGETLVDEERWWRVLAERAEAAAARRLGGARRHDRARRGAQRALGASRRRAARRLVRGDPLRARRPLPRRDRVPRGDARAGAARRHRREPDRRDGALGSRGRRCRPT